MTSRLLRAHRMAFRTSALTRIVPARLSAHEGVTLLVEAHEQGGFVGAAIAAEREPLLLLREEMVREGYALDSLRTGEIAVKVDLEAPSSGGSEL